MPFDPVVFDIYDAWNNSNKRERAAVARGQRLFNTKRINISGVSGINDEPAFGSPANVEGTCTTCHDSPNAGDHSVAAPLDIGIVAASRRTVDMPLYTFREKATGAIKKVTDAGRAMVTGKFKDIGRFKGPILRGLAARAPYFHDGSAATLEQAVEFYNVRFNIGLTKREKSDLAAFLRTL
jgi:cytochrome c peroxidase